MKLAAYYGALWGWCNHVGPMPEKQPKAVALDLYFRVGFDCYTHDDRRYVGAQNNLNLALLRVECAWLESLRART